MSRNFFRAPHQAGGRTAFGYGHTQLDDDDPRRGTIRLTLACVGLFLNVVALVVIVTPIGG